MKISTSNNEYYYDNNTGLIIPGFSLINSILTLKKEDKLSKNEIISVLSNTFEENKISFYYDWLNKYYSFCNLNKISDNNFLNEESIKQHLLKYGFNQIILSVTEDCNFRCSYCAYSDLYKNSRNHSFKYMDFEVAKRAVDIYLNYIIEGKKYNLFRKPTFSFYGGEPLLNFDLIKKIVNYIKKIYPDDIQLTITTNGSLLNKDVADYLMENNFSILVSLDGHVEEQNRKRKYENNQETFNIVFNNIKYLVDKDYEDLFICPVFDWKTDFIKCDDFFKINNLKVLSVSQVDEVYTNSYYNQFSQDDFIKYNKVIKKIKENYVPNKFNYSYLYYLIEYPFVSTLLDSNLINYSKLFHDFTASCTPGDKLFVNSDGEFHMCERVPEIKPLGNVYEGIKFANILKIISDFNKNLSYCEGCDVSFICQKCYRSFMEGEDFQLPDKICSEVSLELQNLLGEAMAFMEKNQKIEKYHIKYNNLFNWRD